MVADIAKLKHSHEYLFDTIKRIYGVDQQRQLLKEIEAVKDESGRIEEGQLKLMCEIVHDHEVALHQYKNVLHQLKDVKKSKADMDYGPSKSKPGNIDMTKLAPEMVRKMGVVPFRWNTRIEDFGPAIYKPFFKRREKIDAIKKYEGDVVYTSPAGGEYLRLLDQARLEASESTRLHAARFLNAIHTGADLSDGKKAVFETKVSDAKAGATNAALYASSVAHKALNKLGRGMWSKSDWTENESFDKLRRARNDALSSLVFQYGPHSGGKSQIMAQFKHILENAKDDPSGMLDANTFRQLMKLIDEEMLEDQDKIIGKDGKPTSISEEMNKLNEALVSDAKNHASEEDKMWKFRLMQMALLITPFAGFSLLGPIFGVAGTVFGSGGFANGIASLATLKEFGPLGDLVEILRIDDAIRWLLGDSPILGDLVSVLDHVITSDIAQNALGGVFSMLATPVLPILFAAAVSVPRFATEIEFSQKYSKIFKGHEKALNAKIQELMDSERVQDSDFKEFVQQKYDLLEKCFIGEGVVNLVDYLNSNSSDQQNLVAEVFGKAFYDSLVENDVIINGQVNIKEMEQYLVDLNTRDAGAYTECANKFLLLRAINQASDNKEDIAKTFADFMKVVGENDQTHIARMVADGQKLSAQDFIFQTAKLRGIAFDDQIIGEENVADRDRVAQELKKQVIEQENKKLTSLVKEMKDGTAKVEEIDMFSLKGMGNSFPSGSLAAPMTANQLGAAHELAVR